MAAPLHANYRQSGYQLIMSGRQSALKSVSRLVHQSLRLCDKKRLKKKDFVSQSLTKTSNSKEKFSRVRSTPDVIETKKTCTETETGKAPFIQLLRERYREACRSVIIRTQNPESTVQSLTSFGPLKFAQCMSKDKQYVLAEFSNESSVKRLQNSSIFFYESKKFPLATRSLYDEGRGSYAAHKKNKSSSVLLEEGNWHLEQANQYPTMESFDEELRVLSASKSLNDLDLRARFLACVLVEDLVRPILPEARVLPYGSCFNGFGWWDSDLDMMLCLQGDPYVPGAIKKPQRSGLPTSFKFLTEVFPTDRMLSQKTLTMVASLLELAPRFNNVYRILNAHVPIVRFFSAALNLHCDVSIEAMDSIKMTELLHLFSALDPRVRPLMAGIKQWALAHSLTASGEQQKPTTIGLLTMLVFYLQTRVPQVLPTFRALQDAAAPNDMFYIDNVVYGIPANPSILPKSSNSESLESLLHGFFLFYSEFDFESKAISIIEGSTFPKPPDSSPVYMENPLVIGHNICKNIGQKYLETFTEQLKVAAQKIELFSPNSEPTSRVDSLCTQNSGMSSRLSFLFSCDVPEIEQQVKIEMSELFEDTHSEPGGVDSLIDATQTNDSHEVGLRQPGSSSLSSSDSFSADLTSDVAGQLSDHKDSEFANSTAGLPTLECGGVHSAKKERLTQKKS